MQIADGDFVRDEQRINVTHFSKADLDVTEIAKACHGSLLFSVRTIRLY